MSTKKLGKKWVQSIKTGLWYATAEEKVAANIKFNNAILRQKGLLKPIVASLKISNSKSNPKKKRNKTPRSMTPTRRSKRVRNKEPENSGLNGLYQEPVQKKLKTGGNNKSRKEYQLSEEDLQALKDLPDWLKDMEEFLLTIPHGKGNKVASKTNSRDVLKQVKKLVSGIGITYRHWEEGISFKRGVKINLGMDFDALYDEAIGFEMEHGDDLGNGWLLRHPITKLKLFQQYRAAAIHRSS